ncbi:lytic transglycosylase domain-containing protein [Achromobacter kerstersii]|uniref:lytic transglycosylase domain-containing protein n=1 Tax=Achromobacter kerstersii TaxID=1353890 RepID=UPI0006C11844|nr:lytic transglycosylase domain-containing protein [Achromobacter kerstersii]CUJ49817.1 type IV secretion system lytic transglycosylase VirB1 [Achromobacter kerstersii]
MDFPSLARQCAPEVHISTLSAVVRHESAFDPLAIGVNSKPHRSIRPKSKEEAIKAAQDLIAKGIDFDVGYGQINVRNWKWLGVTSESIFDPCTNLASAQRVLVECYKRAAKLHGPGQNALYAAFSCYNTGNLTSGFTNGYVGKVIAGAGLRVPAIPRPTASERTKSTGDESAAPNKKSSSRQDAFIRPRNDAFADPRADAFTRPESQVFGRRVPTAPPQR